MRTNINTTVANRNVFGFGQDRVVSSWNDSYACAAQHLEPRHASKRARATATASKRRGRVSAVMAGTVPMVEQTCLAITGPLRLPVRLWSHKLLLS